MNSSTVKDVIRTKPESNEEIKSCVFSIEFTMEADSDSLKKTNQNMRLGRDGNTTDLQFYRNRFQQILNSKIPNSNESIETTISTEHDSKKTEETVKIPESKESIETTKEYNFKETANISTIPNSKKSLETTKQYDFKETEDIKDIPDSTESIKIQEYGLRETENIKEESCNPWSVKSLFEFSHFCCPECDFKTSSNISKNNCKQDFVDHVSTDHPWAISYLQKISDRSVKNITLCAEIKEEPMDYKMSKSKFDSHEINVAEKESNMKDTHETNVTAKLVDDPISVRKDIGEANISEKKMEDSNNDIEDTQENNATSNDTDSQNSLSNNHVTKSEMTIKHPSPDKPKKSGKKRKIEVISENNESQDKIYKCETCGKRYRIYNLLLNHISVVHERKKCENGEISANKQQNRYECDICGKSYMQYISLKKHIGVVHEGKGQFLQRKKPEAKQPKEKIEKIKRLNCSTCGKSYNSISGLKTHTETVHEGKELFNCDRCPKKFNYKSGFEYHYIKDHKLKDQGIDETNFNEHSENPLVAEFLRQKANRSGNAPLIRKKISCKLCGEDYHDKQVHFKEHHTDKDGKIKCPKCELKFHKLGGVYQHFGKIHEMEPCAICGEMKGKYSMTKHLQTKHKINEPKKKFKCEICNKAFAITAKLKEHTNSHTGAKPFLCKFCGKGFGASGSHWNHEKSCARDRNKQG